MKLINCRIVLLLALLTALILTGCTAVAPAPAASAPTNSTTSEATTEDEATIEKIEEEAIEEEATEAADSEAAEAVIQDGVFPVTIEHKFGTITIPEEPKRVISVGYSEQDPLLALGVIPVAVRYWFANEPYAVWPWGQEALGDGTPEVLNMGWREINFEAIAALQPDLIVGTHSGMDQNEYDLLSQIAPTLAQPGEYVDFGVPWQEQTRLIGKALGREQQALDLIAEVEQKIADAAAAHPEFQGAEIAMVMPSDGIYWVTGHNTPPIHFLNTLGFVMNDEVIGMVGDDTGAEVSEEQLHLIDADVLFYNARTSAGLEDFLNSPLMQQLDVVKNGRTILFENNTVYIYGALSFSTILSVSYAADELVPVLAQAMRGELSGYIPAPVHE